MIVQGFHKQNYDVFLSANLFIRNLSLTLMS